MTLASSIHASRGASKGASSLRSNDRRFVLILSASLLALIVVVTLFAPTERDDDPRPTTYNTGSAGAKATYLLLQSLGYRAERWEAPTAGLRDLDAAHTTLILADPIVPFNERNEVRSDLAAFLAHGGRVLVTGVLGAALFDGVAVRKPTNLSRDLCITTPEGQGPLARAGSLSMPDLAAWDETDLKARVEQRCGSDAVVVLDPVGEGEIVWWSSAMPLTNQGLKQDASLRLLLASVGGPDRRILFDEGLEGYATPLWATAKGLPLWALWLQAGLAAVLLVLSFSRRSGPVRAPVHVVRGSPLEFAESMGNLYRKAGATAVATDGARLRLLRFLHGRCGIPQATLRATPSEIAQAVEEKMGGHWPDLRQDLRQDLEQAAQAEQGRPVAPRSALALVRRLDRDMKQISLQITKHGVQGKGIE
jgi:hypothetical protein